MSDIIRDFLRDSANNKQTLLEEYLLHHEVFYLFVEDTSSANVLSLQNGSECTGSLVSRVLDSITKELNERVFRILGYLLPQWNMEKYFYYPGNRTVDGNTVRVMFKNLSTGTDQVIIFPLLWVIEITQVEDLNKAEIRFEDVSASLS